MVEDQDRLGLRLILDPTLAGPDPKVRRTLGVVAVCCLVGALAIAGTILLAWWLPALADVLPAQWRSMVGATGMVLLLYGIALCACLLWPDSILALAITCVGLLLTAVGLLGWVFTDNGGPAVLLSGPSHTGAPSSLQTLAWELLFGIGVAVSQTRARWAGRLTTAFVAVVGLWTLVLVSAHVFSAQEIIATSLYSQNSPTTALTMSLLLCAWYAVMQFNGRWPLATSATATGHLIRLLLPVMVFGPLVMAGLAVALGAVLGWQRPLSLAVSLTTTVALLVVAMMVVARRVWRLEQAYQRLACTDPLTGLLNRRGLNEVAAPILSTARRENRLVAVAAVDLVGLKRINDTQGHDAGSQVIVAMADGLRGVLRRSDIVARVGGDEFLVLAVGDMYDLRVAFDRLAVDSTTSDGITVPDYSLGLAEGNPDDFESVWRTADRRMYDARASRVDGRLDAPRPQVGRADDRAVGGVEQSRR
ncbi:MAG: diguanylate cyclase [Actinobacteria bacterium]|nr:diguanylate cyclase [Actinomycetota bacterium]MCB9412494.1 diguanylate cyclase [Actinomycetota bacterium]